MLENLIDLIREQAGSAVINNPDIPNDQNEAVITQAGQSITGGLQNLVSQGNLQSLLGLFENGTDAVQNHPAVQNISANFVQQLVEKFGLNQSAASGVASELIPSVLQNLVHKTNDPADSSFNLQGILSRFGGAQGIEGLLGSFGGNSQSGGVLDKVKALFA